MKLFLLKLKTSVGAIGRILASPSYSILATVLALVVMWLFLWLFNLQLLFSVLSSSSLDVFEKISFTLAGYQSLFTNFDRVQAISLAAFSILSGINLAALIYILRHGEKARASGSTNFFAAVGALIGSGCAVCGASILTPLVALFGGSLSVAASQTIGMVATSAGIILLLYSIYGLGKAGSQVIARTSGDFKL